MRKNCLVLHFVVIGLFLFPTLALSQGMAPASRAPGKPAGSYKLGGFDSVNLFTGNLNFDLPLHSSSGRGEIGHDISMTLDTQWGVNDYQNVFGDSVLEFFPTIQSPIAFIGNVTATSGSPVTALQEPACANGPIYWVDHQFNFKYVEPNGTEHMLVDPTYRGRPFRQCGAISVNYGRVFESKAGEFITLITDADTYTTTNAPTGTLYLKNGTKSRIVDGKIAWTMDRNGNKIDYTHVNIQNTSRLQKIKDSVGREISFEYGMNDVAPYGLCDRIIWKGFNGNDRIIRISRDTLDNLLRNTQPGDSGSLQTISYLFNDDPKDNVTYSNGSTTNGNSPEVKAVWLPDGRSYQFRYNVYGRLARVTLPTGGSLEYDYSPPLVGFGGDTVPYIIHRVAEKRIYDGNNNLEGKTVFTPTLGTGSPISVEMFDANQNRLSKTKHYFSGSPNGEFPYTIRWDNGKETRVEEYATDGATMLRRIEYTWRQRITSWCISSYPGNVDPDRCPIDNPFVIETKTILADTNQVSKVSSVNPTTGDWAYDAYNNPTDVWYYDFGAGVPGGLLKRVHTDYVTDGRYLDSYLRALPRETWVSADANGSIKAQLTQFEYDNYREKDNGAPLIDRSGVVGHDTPNFGTSKLIRGNITKITSYANAQNQTGAISAYSQYDILGNVVAIIDANEKTSTIAYSDKFGSPDHEVQSNSAPSQLNGQATFAFPTATTNVLGWTEYAQFDYFTGNPVNVEDVRGIISKTFYNDPLDRPKQSVSAVGTALEAQTTITYDDANRRVETKTDFNELDDNLIKAESFYDGHGRTYEERSFKESGYVAVTTEYDALGRPKRVTNPHVGAPEFWTETYYDGLGRAIKIRTPDNAEVNSSFSGNAVTVTDQAGKLRRSIINALGQLKRIDEPTDPNNNGIGSLGDVQAPNQKTDYTYDVLNNLVGVSQSGSGNQCGPSGGTCSQTRTFGYNGLSRLTSASNPESGTISYGYDGNGNLTSKTDARGVTTSYIYDDLNRITNRNYLGGAFTPNVTYTYDDLPNAKGRLTKVTNGTGIDRSTTEYLEFDVLGRVKRSKQITDGVEYGGGTDPNTWMTYKYNLAGALEEQQYPSGRVVKNVMRNDGNLSSVQSKKNIASGYLYYADNFTYNAAGAVTSMKLGNGLWESTIFNSRLQPMQIALGTVLNGTDKLDLDYTYGTTNNNGNVLTQDITVVRSGQSPLVFNQTYTYDELNRLKSAQENSGTSWKQTYSFDRYGNRNFDTGNTNQPTVFNAVTNPSFNTTNNRMTSGQGYSYDLAGNVTADANGQSYVYDAENKQTSASNGGGQLGQYYFDGDGKRVKKVVPSSGETTIFVYDVTGKMVAEYSTNVVPAQNARVQYLTNDYLGTPRINTDRDAAVTSRTDYMPYGEEIIGLGGRSSSDKYVTDDVRHGFTGYINDGETGLDFAQARIYPSSLGRFTSPDPYNVILEKERGEDEDERDDILIGFISNPQRWNMYVYVVNNPLAFTDPDGQKPRTINVFVEEGVISQEDLEKWKQWAASAQKKDKELTVNIYMMNKDTPGTVNAFLESLKAKDTATVFMGHSYGQRGISFNGTSIGNSQDNRRGRVTNTADGIDIQNAVLAVFSCGFGNGFDNITSSNGTAFVSIVQGPEATTRANATNAAAFSFVKSIAAGSWESLLLSGTLDVAKAQAQSGIDARPSRDRPSVMAGDYVNYRILPPPRKGR